MIDIEGFRQYLCEEELSTNTIQSYLYALRTYAKKYPEISKSNLIAFKQEQLLRYQPATVNLRIAALIAYCRYAKIPMRLKSVRLPNRTSVENVITSEQIDTLLRGLARDGDRCWYVNILLLSKTGMRISEACRVTKNDLLAGSVTLYTKGHLRTIFFPRKLLGEVLPDIAALSAGDRIVRGHRGRPICSETVRSGLTRLAERYGIPKQVMHPHSFRHYYAIEFLKRRNDIALLSDLLGHCSVDMTRIYLRQSQESQRDAVDQIVNW